MSDLKQLSQKRYWGGILALGGVVLIWVSSSFAMNVSENPQLGVWKIIDCFCRVSLGTWITTNLFS